MFSQTDCVSTSPWRLRSSGRKPTPGANRVARRARRHVAAVHQDAARRPAGRRRRRCARARSGPAPSSPATPTISPRQTVRLTSSTPAAADTRSTRSSSLARRGAAARESDRGRRGSPSAAPARRSRRRARSIGSDVPAVAQHGHAIADRGRARACGARCRRCRRPRAVTRRMTSNRLVDLASRQRRGRLVHDEDARSLGTAPSRPRPSAARRCRAIDHGDPDRSPRPASARLRRAASRSRPRAIHPARDGSWPRRMFSATRQRAAPG